MLHDCDHPYCAEYAAYTVPHAAGGPAFSVCVAHVNWAFDELQGRQGPVDAPGDEAEYEVIVESAISEMADNETWTNPPRPMRESNGES